MRDTRLPKYKWWDKESKSMLGPELDENYKILTAAKGEMFLVDTSRQDEDGWDWEMDVVWLQYAGLKDKNGKEIYEGDIYHQGDRNIRYVVVRGDTGLIGEQIGTHSYAGLQHWKDKIEVIGNRWGNPELLGEGRA